MEIETDVLIIGAGPSGSIAARTIAKEGIDVWIIDKKSEIGTPKRCAEGIVKSTLDELDIKVDERWISRDIRGLHIVSSDNHEVIFDENNFNLPDTAYVLERKVFDKHLVMDAIRYGAKVSLKTHAYDLKRTSDGFIVYAKQWDKDVKIHAHIVIAADGTESTIGKMAGLNTKTQFNNMASCIQYEMVNVKLEYMNHVHIYIGKVAPGGYVWIFPKGDDIANVGLGVLKTHATENAKYYLDNFIKNNSSLKKAQIVEVNVGGDPVGGLVEERVSDNILVVGDAAGYVDPLTGDGIRTAMLSGKYAGIVASKAIKSKDYSSQILSEYYDITDEKIGKEFSKFNKIKEFLLTLDDDSLNKIVSEISKTDMKNADLKTLFKIIIKSSPKSLLKLGKLF
ncbi:MAG: NAD(P)/FAD-dependent oxidoreductase [Methanosphaera sp.]|nr:NAD(P)/FAD-dependent oxidoreductase [Methanosphaera sp.]